ncbi:MAG: hypothetical protein LBR16_07860 [Treponema sp.]|jgi:hypothetical protein|nr:hypothetical protein [Treponema sp.]
MAVQPIDLQTLFTQMDKVGKEQALSRDGAQIQAGLQAQESRRRQEAQVQAVNQAQDLGDGAEGIHGWGGRGAGGGSGKQKQRQDDKAPPKKPPRCLEDPMLGRNVDISG